ncbi:MAG: hypothetical protein J2P44_04970 [Candidatus Dormibacteraeota bacterium]|nr:hypothetical protein [Candidatus Dormibacteraeota bacterium]
MLLAATTFSFPVSAFPPLALGFFGLGTGYLIYGPQELFGYPQRDAAVDRTTGLWGIWMPGFMQFLTGMMLWIGLVWFNTFREAPLYMAALAFTAYGVHWFAIGGARFLGADPRPNGFMSIAFTVISLLGVVVFFKAGDWPVGILFILLTLIYIADFFGSLRLYLRPWPSGLPYPGRTGALRGERGPVNLGERALGALHLITGLWLMYLTWAAALTFAAGIRVPV